MAKARLLVEQTGEDGLAELGGLANDLGKFERLNGFNCIGSWPVCAGRNRTCHRDLPSAVRPRNWHLTICRYDFCCCNAPKVPRMWRRRSTWQQRLRQSRRGGAVTLFSQAICDLTRYQADKEANKSALQSARDKLLQAQQIRPKWMQLPLLLGKNRARGRRRRGCGTGLSSRDGIRLPRRGCDPTGDGPSCGRRTRWMRRTES